MSVKSGTNPRNVTRKILVTAGIAAAVYLVATFAGQPQILSLTLSSLVGGVALVVQFLIDFETRLSTMDARQQEDSADLKRSIRRRIVSISKATELFGHVEAAQLRTDTVVELVQYATRITLGKDSLIAKLAASEIDSLTRFLKQAVDNQDAEYDGPEQDWMYALVDNSQMSIKATSTIGPKGQGYVDDEFWRSQAARTYLDKQRRAADRGVLVRRIFLTHDPSQIDPQELDEIIERNQDAKIEVRVLTLADIPPDRQEPGDFILFDDEISYEFTSGPSFRAGESSTILNTRLRLRADRVRNRKDRFDELWELAHAPK